LMLVFGRKRPKSSWSREWGSLKRRPRIAAGGKEGTDWSFTLKERGRGRSTVSPIGEGQNGNDPITRGRERKGQNL